MLSLRTLGTLDLTAADGRSLQSVLSQPRRAALLVYLATARPYGPQRRDRLLPLFWSENDEASARHALNQALYRLRQSLGRGTIETVGKNVLRLNDDILKCDVRAFDKAVTEHRWGDALDLYQGEFLCGFHVAGAPGFERWLDSERERLQEAAADTAWALAADQLRGGAVTDAERTAQRAVDLGPTGEEKVLGFVEALAAAGDRAAAVHFYERWAAALGAKLEISPSAATMAAAEAIRAGEGPAGGPPESPIEAPGRTAADSPGPGPGADPPAGHMVPPDTVAPSTQQVGGGPLPRNRSAVWRLAAGAGIALMAAIVFLSVRELSPRTTDPTLINAVNVTGLLMHELDPTWSPDGNALAYEAMEGGDQDIWVTQLGTGQATNRTEDSPARDQYPRWSPDGRWIVFFSNRQSGRGYYLMPAMGGEPRLVAPRPDGVVSPAEWSPDGTALAYGRGSDRQHRWIEILTLADGATRQLSLPERPRSNFVADMRWSPDGRFLAVHRAFSASARTGELWLLRISDGASFQLTDGTHWDMYPSWSPDSRVLYFTSDRGRALDLWKIPLGDSGRPEGAPKRVTVGLEIYQAEIAPDGRKLAYAKGGPVENVFRAPLEADRVLSWADVKQLTFDATDLCCFDVRNGRLVLGSRRSGTHDLWVMPAEGGVPQPLTSDSALDAGVHWKPDGSQVLFHSTRSGHRQVWVVPADGGAARQLTHGEGERRHPVWSPTGPEIVLVNERGLAVLSLTDDTERQLTVGPDEYPAWSPDGRWVAFMSTRDGRARIWRVPAAGGKPEPLSRTSGWRPVWSADGERIYFLGAWEDREARNTVWVLSLNSGEERPVLALEGQPGWLVAGLAVNEQYVYFAWGLWRADIWVADLRPPAGQG